MANDKDMSLRVEVNTNSGGDARPASILEDSHGPTGSTVGDESKIVALWLFASRDSCSDGVPQTFLRRSGEVDKWSIDVTIGQIENSTRLALASLAAVVEGLTRGWNGVYGRGPDASVFARRDDDIDAMIGEFALDSEWTEPATIYTTIALGSTVTLKSDPTRGESRYFWYDVVSAQQIAKKTLAERDGLLGLVAANIGTPELDLFHRQYGSPRILVLGPGKPIQPIVGETVGTATVSRGMSSGAVRNMIAACSFPARQSRDISSIGLWLLDAAIENDPFKRFLWSYAGLEVIAMKVAKRSKDRFLSSSRLTLNGEEIHETIFKELLWPSATDESRDPSRNLKFRFGLTAALLDPNNAATDFRNFKQCYDYRNGIHGSFERHTSPPHGIAYSLLRKYCRLAADHLRS